METKARTHRGRRLLRRAMTVVMLTPVISLALAGVGSTASPWNVDIVSAVRTDLTVTIAGTAYSPAGQASGNYLEIAWGDGAGETLTPFVGSGPWSWGPVAHTYASDGTYTITATLLHASPRGNDRNATDTVVIVIPDDGGDDPVEVDVQVALGECSTDGLTSSTPVNVVYSGDGDATVSVRDAEDNTVASFTGTGSEALAPGTHTYIVTAAEGSTLAATSDSQDQLDVIDCTPSVDAQGSVNVSPGKCDSIDGESVTPVTITIAPNDGASVFLAQGETVIDTFTGSGGSIDLAPGDYVWTATPSDGFELTGLTAGGFTTEDCPSIVFGGPPLTSGSDDPSLAQLPKQLAKTGLSLPAALAMALLLAVAGAWFIVVPRRVQGAVGH